ncbi:MAG: DUF3103 domain-containing protein [Candidatus Marinimicrobia bacterium]|nr:DUF3103 domain-containing protein [Candidatus Neomarinimicrobiota bacterium]
MAYPVGFEQWNGETPIWVAYTPLTIDDTEWKDIIAFDAQGKRHVLDAKTPPDQPVLVVGINERTDENGNVIGKVTTNIGLGKQTMPGGGSGGGGGGGGSGSASRFIRIYEYKLDHYYGAYEAWPFGDAEISFHITTGPATDDGIIYTENAVAYWYEFGMGTYPYNYTLDQVWSVTSSYEMNHNHTNWEIYEWHKNTSWQSHNKTLDPTGMIISLGWGPSYDVDRLLDDGVSTVYLFSFEQDMPNDFVTNSYTPPYAANNVYDFMPDYAVIDLTQSTGTDDAGWWRVKWDIVSVW